MNEVVGFIACLIAGVCFGSNFIPVKKYEVGDGVFFQWVMCCAIWCVGLFTVAFEDNTHFHPFTMLGGALWCTGNFACLQVIKLIGMSMGLMVWGILNSVVSWAAGKWGLFGLHKEHIGDTTLNYIGLSLTVLSLACFSHVKTTIEKNPRNSVAAASLLDESLLSDAAPVKEKDWVDQLNPKLRQTIGFVMAMLCGVFFGLNFVPPEYEIAHADGDSTRSKKEFDYIFSHFCGIFITSTLFMIGYCAFKKNKPFVDGQLVLPAFASGILWAIAQVCWFIAIQNLQMVVANPIITSLPSIVAGFWGIVLFKEIQGMRNLGLFGTGLFFAIIGVVLVALSK